MSERIENPMPAVSKERGTRSPNVSLSEYDLRYTIRHLKEAGRFALANQFLELELTDGVDPQSRSANTWYTAQYASGQVGQFLEDVELCLTWTHSLIEANIDELGRHLGLELRYWLATASIATLARQIRPAMLRALIHHGFWSPRQALAYALKDPHNTHRSEALTAIATYLREPLRKIALTESIAAARASGPQVKVKLLAEVLPALDDDSRLTVFREILEYFRAMKPQNHSAEPWATHYLTKLLRQLMSSLDDQEKQIVLGCVLETHSVDGKVYSSVLPSIIPFMSGDQLMTYIESAWEIETDALNSATIIAAAFSREVLPERKEWIRGALDRVAGEQRPSRRLAAKCLLLSSLDGGEYDRVLVSSHNDWRSLDGRDKALGAATLARFLPAGVRPAMLDIALAYVGEHTRFAGEAIKILAPILEGDALRATFGVLGGLTGKEWRQAVSRGQTVAR